ncbi:uncharacterized protein isoform X1 [Leptinotarsa decemlineata]|uniref:uncharacterized protein isoform X1 n=1 Tax=Leptinotarsa decemlineata TaxID=7539 RepID=UPI003D306743
MVEGPPNEGRQDKSGRFVPGPPAGVKRGKIVGKQLGAGEPKLEPPAGVKRGNVVEKQLGAGKLKLEPPAGVKRRNVVLDQVGAGKLKPGSPTGVKRENRETQNKAKGLSSGGSGGQNFENLIGLRSEGLVGHTVRESQTEPSGLKFGGPASRVEVVEEQDRLEKPVPATQEPIGTRTDQQVEREVPGPQESGTVVPEAVLEEDEKAARRQRLEKIIRRVGEASKMLRGMFSKRQLVVLDRLKPCEGGIPQSRKGALPERKNSFTAVLPTCKHDRAIVERNQRELRERELMCATGVFSVPRMGTGTGSVTGSRSRVDSGLVIQRAADVGGILCDGNPRPTIQLGADAGGILCDGNPQPTRCKAEPRCAQTLRGPCPASKGDAQQQQAEVVARQTQGGPCLAETTDARNQAQAVVKQTKGGPCFPGEAAADNQAEAVARQTKEGPCLARAVKANGEVKAVARQTQGGPCLAQIAEADTEVEGEAEQTPRGPCSAKTPEANSRPMTDLEEFISTDPLGSGYRRKHAEATLKFSMKPISEGSSDTIAKQRRHQARTDAAIAEPNPKEPKERQPKCVTGTTGVSRSGTKAGGVTGSCSQGEGLLAGPQGSGPLRRTRTEAGNRYLMKPILKGGSNVIGDLHRKLPKIDAATMRFTKPNLRELKKRELACVTGTLGVSMRGTYAGCVTGSSQEDSGQVDKEVGAVRGTLREGSSQQTRRSTQSGTEAEPAVAQTLRGPCPADSEEAQQRGGTRLRGSTLGHQAEVAARHTQRGPCLAQATEAPRQAEAEARHTLRGHCLAGSAEATSGTVGAPRNVQREGDPCSEAKGEAEYTQRGPCSAVNPKANSRPRNDLQETLLAGSLKSESFRRTRTEAGSNLLMKPILYSEGAVNYIGDIWLQRNDATRELKQPKALAHSGGSPRLLRRTAGPDAHGGSLVWNEDCLPGCSWPATHEAEGGTALEARDTSRKPKRTVHWGASEWIPEAVGQPTQTTGRPEYLGHVITEDVGCLLSEEYLLPEVTLEQLPEKLAEEIPRSGWVDRLPSRHKRPHLEGIEDPAQRAVVPKNIKRRKGLPPEEVAWTPGEPPGKTGNGMGSVRKRTEPNTREPMTNAEEAIEGIMQCRRWNSLQKTTGEIPANILPGYTPPRPGDWSIPSRRGPLLEQLVARVERFEKVKRLDRTVKASLQHTKELVIAAKGRTCHRFVKGADTSSAEDREPPGGQAAEKVEGRKPQETDRADLQEGPAEKSEGQRRFTGERRVGDRRRSRVISLEPDSTQRDQSQAATREDLQKVYPAATGDGDSDSDDECAGPRVIVTRALVH